jgi:hypothetical protein
VDGLDDELEERYTTECCGGSEDPVTAIACLVSCADRSARDTFEGSRLSYRTPYSSHSDGAREVGAVEQPVPALDEGNTEELREDGSDDRDDLAEGLIQLGDIGE